MLFLYLFVRKLAYGIKCHRVFVTSGDRKKFKNELNQTAMVFESATFNLYRLFPSSGIKSCIGQVIIEQEKYYSNQTRIKLKYTARGAVSGQLDKNG